MFDEKKNREEEDDMGALGGWVGPVLGVPGLNQTSLVSRHRDLPPPSRKGVVLHSSR